MTVMDATTNAIAALRRGEVIGLPTETVYGLAADAANPAAVRRIFELKGRPADHPVIVHLGDVSQLSQWARVVSPLAQALAARFWPGPMTLILPRAPQVSDLITGGQDTVGVRIPNHPLALSVLRAFGGGLAAPSANRFGRVSPTRAAHVIAEFGDAVPIVLDGGDCEIGIESTIVDVSGALPRILRPGRISLEAIAALIGPVAEGAEASSPRVSGALKAHYAPRTPLELLSATDLNARSAQMLRGTLVIAVDALPPGAQGLSLSRDPNAYARGLYAALRELDARGASRLLIEQPPDTPAWHAIRDRLTRAAAGAGLEDAEP